MIGGGYLGIMDSDPISFSHVGDFTNVFWYPASFGIELFIYAVPGGIAHYLLTGPQQQ